MSKKKRFFSAIANKVKVLHGETEMLRNVHIKSVDSVYRSDLQFSIFCDCETKAFHLCERSYPHLY